MNRKLVILIAITLSFRAILSLIINPSNPLQLSPDEHKNFEIAQNYVDDKGYVLYNSIEQKYEKNSFHPTFPVFTYIWLIKNQINLQYWTIFIFVLILIFFGISIISFYNLALNFIPSDLAYYSTVVYCFFPSIIYVGMTSSLYENLVLPMLVVIVSRMLQANKKGFNKLDYILVPFLVVFSCLYRPQLLLIYAILFLVFTLFRIKEKKWNLLLIPCIVLPSIILSHIPIFLKNHHMFGHYVLNTQTGFELLQGHNPFARGSWNGSWKNPENEFYKYIHHEIPNIQNLNQYEENKARQELALTWIKENPLKEIQLSFRKLLIYFTPQNYGDKYGARLYNPINFIVYLGFIIAIIVSIAQKRWDREKTIIISPIIGSILLSLVFFVGYRWRLYAEPFMIIFSFVFFYKFIVERKKTIHNEINEKSSF